MRDGFARVGAVVDDDAKAGGEVEFSRDPAGGGEQVAEQRFVAGGGFGDARDELFRDDEQMDRRLRLDIVEDDTVFVLEFDFRGDFAVDDFLKDGLGHDLFYRRNGGNGERSIGSSQNQAREAIGDLESLQLITAVQKKS